MEIYKGRGLLPARKARRLGQAETVGFIEREAATLDRPDDPWGTYDSHLRPDVSSTSPSSYQEAFSSTLPEGQPWLKQYIEGLKAAKIARTNNPNISFTGLDLFGQGTNLFSEFIPGTFTQTAANSLTDQRKLKQRYTDGLIHNTFVPGDYFDPEIRRQIRNALNNAKVDVIFMKAIAGRFSIPHNPFLIARELQELWSMLETEGVMLVQIPREIKDLVNPWIKKLRQDGTIDAKYGVNNYTGHFLRLNRHAGAPEELPFLTRQEVVQMLQAT